ncbi:hypothetical protein BRD56_05975 [Thermoplasmatales archaeon SW_10_69_26]|nr:MAG: hypothetical protein BRD56_05975 [Thermoplasmatales archaeon SW_10_69_26]
MHLFIAVGLADLAIASRKPVVAVPVVCLQRGGLVDAGSHGRVQVVPRSAGRAWQVQLLA